MPRRLNIADRVQFVPPYCRPPLEDRTGTIVNVLRDCAGLLYYVELDGKPYCVGRAAFRIIDSCRAGLRKLPTTKLTK
jgi:hypothetical protein